MECHRFKTRTSSNLSSNILYIPNKGSLKSPYDPDKGKPKCKKRPIGSFFLSTKIEIEILERALKRKGNRNFKYLGTINIPMERIGKLIRMANK